MPKEFPQIRFQGEKDIAAGHIKRGLLELFRTQMVQERAGVPIMKRTVKVDEGTSITVQIANEQTFVDITSVLLPGYVAPESEELRKIRYGRCPPAFIVRKMSRNTNFAKDSLGPKYADNTAGFIGYLVAWNGTTRKWETVTYNADVLGPFKGAYTSGWWHLNRNKKKLSGKYNSCDVITWAGGGGGLSNTGWKYIAKLGDYRVPSAHFFQPYFYHGGQEILSGGGHVLGVCILKDSVTNQDFYHILTIQITTTIYSYGNVHSGSGLTVRKRPVSGGATTTIQQLNYFTSNPSPWFSADYQGAHPDGLPAGSAHMDKDGFAWMMRRYRALDNSGVTSGNSGFESTQLIKIDMRNGNLTIIKDGPDAIETGQTFSDYQDDTLTYRKTLPGNPAPVVPPDPFNVYSARSGTRSNAEPLTVAMFGGLDKLYTYDLTCTYDFSMGGRGNFTPGEPYERPGLPPWYTPIKYWKQIGVMTQHRREVGKRELVVMENLTKQVDRIALEEIDTDFDMKQNITFAGDDDLVTAGPISGSSYTRHVLRWVQDHHPQIKDSWEYTEREMITDVVSGAGQVTYRHVAFGKVLSSSTSAIPRGPLSKLGNRYDSGDVEPRLGFPDENWSALADVWDPNPVWLVSRQSERWYLDPVRYVAASGPVLFPERLGWSPGAKVTIPSISPTVSGLYRKQQQIQWIGGNLGSVASDNVYSTVSGNSSDHSCGWGARIRITAYGYGDTDNGDSFQMYGNGEGWLDIAQRSTSPWSEARTLHRPERWAVHRPTATNGEVPYIAIGRKAYQSSMPLSQRVNPDYGFSTGSMRYDDARAVPNNWSAVFLSFGDPSENLIPGYFDNDVPFYQSLLDVPKIGFLFWRKPLGNAKEGYTGSELTFHSNILTEAQLNAIIGIKTLADETPGEPKHMHFEIGVL